MRDWFQTSDCRGTTCVVCHAGGGRLGTLKYNSFRWRSTRMFWLRNDRQVILVHLIQRNRLIISALFTNFSWYSVKAIVAQRSQRGKQKDERSTENGMALSVSGCSVALLTARCGCQ